MLVRPSERIFRTLDPDIYRHLRQGEFRYDIPLQAGSYELHLYFAETGLADFISAESSGEGQRVFRVSANGKLILDFFDVVADAAGSNTSDERVFRDVSPADDGYLHLSFTSIRGSPMLSGIEVLPMNKGKAQPGTNSNGLDVVVAGYLERAVARGILLFGWKCAGAPQESSLGERLTRYGAVCERAVGTFFLRGAGGRRPVSREIEIL